MLPSSQLLIEAFGRISSASTKKATSPRVLMDFSLPSNPKENPTEERGEVSTKEHSDLLSSLPKQRGFLFPLRMYKGFWIAEGMFPRLMALQDHFKPRPSDLILVTLPKSGTTWLKAFLFTIMNRTNYTFAQHPLLTRNPHECVPYLEIPFGRDRFPDLEAIPPPRLVATHLPYSILRSSVADCGCRLVYLCRDPKDVLVSHWHFAHERKPDIMGLGEAFELFYDGSHFAGRSGTIISSTGGRACGGRRRCCS